MLTKFGMALIDLPKVSFVGRVDCLNNGWGFVMVCDGSGLFLSYSTQEIAARTKAELEQLLDDKNLVTLEAPSK